MNTRYLKTIAFVLALLFLSGCAVTVRDDGGFHHHHHRYRHWHSSLQQSSPSMAQMTAQDNRDSVSYEQVTR